QALRGAGAEPRCVAPYVYADAADAAAVRALLLRLRSGEVDAIAFTSQAQVARLFAVAEPVEVQAALAATQVAAVGPVVAAALRERGVTVGAMPESSWFMKPLSAELARLLRDAAARAPERGAQE
ncbi:MAG: uroporphyrinogen-III synthase, partial [Proteobacteria bacterium]|nr:uroporphyrinogen-III synthase [Pseudomonadota bacterium]